MSVRRLTHLLRLFAFFAAIPPAYFLPGVVGNRPTGPSIVAKNAKRRKVSEAIEAKFVRDETTLPSVYLKSVVLPVPFSGLLHFNLPGRPVVVLYLS
jgi:hypothetical protein